jgi:Nucleotidyl transferase AbiEii toxin, Type IV TA system
VTDAFDHRVVGPDVLAFLRACGQVAPFHLGGGAAAASVSMLRNAGSLVRARLSFATTVVDADIIYEPAHDLEPPPPAVEGVVVESLVDLRVSKLTCILSRSEPRDLVDLFFLDRAGHPPEADLALALQKDAGVDPAVIAWLLGQVPVEPLPVMLLPLNSAELRVFRDDLRERFRRLAVPGDA